MIRSFVLLCIVASLGNATPISEMEGQETRVARRVTRGVQASCSASTDASRNWVYTPTFTFQGRQISEKQANEMGITSSCGSLSGNPGPNTGTGAVGSGNNIKDLVGWHNKKRSEIATNAENYNNQPKATNMNEVVWDENLASKAQEWSSRCGLIHTPDVSYGQNIAEFPSNTPVTIGANAWFYEVHSMQPSYNVANFPGDWVGVGHYTQVVWAETTKIGCGVTICGENANLVCNYNTGNVEQTPVYKTTGTTCSGGSEPGLCAPGSSQAGGSGQTGGNLGSGNVDQGTESSGTDTTTDSGIQDYYGSY